jgi:hypothetical protein
VRVCGLGDLGFELWIVGFKFWVLGFGRLGFRVQSRGFSVVELWCRVTSFGIRGNMGFRVCDIRSMVRGLQYRVLGLALGVKGSGFRVQGSVLGVPGSGCTGFTVQASSIRVQGSGFRVHR